MSESTKSDTIDSTDTGSVPNDRRALLRKLAIGGAGAAAGAVLLSNGNASAAPVTVIGSTDDATLFGVTAENTAPVAAADTDPVPTAQKIDAPNGAHLLLVAGGAVGPAKGKHVAGEVYVDKDGTLWFTVPAEAPSTTPPAETLDAGAVRFVKLAGTPTAGAYHAINPQRAYDSRQPNYTVKGQMAPKSSRVIAIADGHSANGTVTLADAVPVGATAAQINVTAANMTGPNFLSVAAGDVASTETSLLNWYDGDKQIANSIVVPVDAERKIKVFCGDQTGSTDVIIDVFGYYL